MRARKRVFIELAVKEVINVKVRRSPNNESMPPPFLTPTVPAPLSSQQRGNTANVHASGCKVKVCPRSFKKAAPKVERRCLHYAAAQASG